MDKNKKKYIYESPDNGKTIYRREFGDYDSPKELMAAQDNTQHSKYYYEFDRNKPVMVTEDSRDIEFKTIADILAKANLFGLEVEVVWSSLKALKEAKSEISMLTALQRGANEWDI